MRDYVKHRASRDARYEKKAQREIRAQQEREIRRLAEEDAALRAAHTICRWCDGPSIGADVDPRTDGSWVCSLPCSREERAAQAARLEYSRSTDGTWRWSLRWKCPGCGAGLSIPGGIDKREAPPASLWRALFSPREWVVRDDCWGCEKARRRASREHAARAR